jgi:hypothetical protein
MRQIMKGTDRENARRLYAALRQLVNDLVDAEDDRNPESGEEYDSCRHAQDVLLDLRDVYGSASAYRMWTEIEKGRCFMGPAMITRQSRRGDASCDVKEP